MWIARPDSARPSAGDRRLGVIQNLRGAAALGVVMLHAQGQVSSLYPNRIPPFLVGAAGVDVFFVISGFVMAYSCQHMFGDRRSVLPFLYDRAVRIIPIYWLVSIVYYLYIVAFENSRGNIFLLTKELLRSMLFVEAADHTYPLIPSGWTLNYEMVFYIIFALFIALPKRQALTGVIVTIIGLIVFRNGLPDRLDVFSTPAMLEFVGGLLLAEIYLKGWRFPRAVSYVLIASAIAVIAVAPAPDSNWWWQRGIEWGPPAVVIAAAGILVVRTHDNIMTIWLRRLGDISYSLYVVHLVVFAILAKVTNGMALPTAAAAVATYLGLLALAILSGSLLNRAVEVPVSRWLKRWRPGRQRPWRHGEGTHIGEC